MEIYNMDFCNMTWGYSASPDTTVSGSGHVCLAEYKRSMRFSRLQLPPHTRTHMYTHPCTPTRPYLPFTKKNQVWLIHALSSFNFLLTFSHEPECLPSLGLDLFPHLSSTFNTFLFSKAFIHLGSEEWRGGTESRRWDRWQGLELLIGWP